MGAELLVPHPPIFFSIPFSAFFVRCSPLFCVPLFTPQLLASDSGSLRSIVSSPEAYKISAVLPSFVWKLLLLRSLEVLLLSSFVCIFCCRQAQDRCRSPRFSSFACKQNSAFCIIAHIFKLLPSLFSSLILCQNRT